MSDNTVVSAESAAPKPQNTYLSKAQVHAKLMRGWARGIDKHGKGAFADKIGVSAPALDKQLSGSMPGFDVIDAALDAEPSVLDDYIAAKGKRIVNKDAVCDVDDIGLLLSRLLVMINEAEHPEGPGGRAIVPQEYLAGEKLMRQVHQVSAQWLEKCAQIRRPVGVAA